MEQHQTASKQRQASRLRAALTRNRFRLEPAGRAEDGDGGGDQIGLQRFELEQDVAEATPRTKPQTRRSTPARHTWRGATRTAATARHRESGARIKLETVESFTSPSMNARCGMCQFAPPRAPRAPAPRSAYAHWCLPQTGFHGAIAGRADPIGRSILSR